MEKPLKGMKILDFTYLLPGPFGTMVLADLGAEIIKVENPLNPDLMRLVPPHVDGISAAYAHLNRGKKSLALNLRDEKSREIIFRLAGEYDIVIEQFRPGVMDRMGLGYEDLKLQSPGLIYCSLTGYGQTGSYARRAGHDINYLALSGIESFSGRRDAGPSLSGVQVADLAGGSQNMVIALLAAYIRRLRTGQGEWIDVSITEGVFSLSLFQTAGFLVDGILPMAESEILNGGAFYDFYRTSDGRYLSVGPIEPKFFETFLHAIGMKPPPGDTLLRPEELAEFKREIAARIAGRTQEEWGAIFRDLDACVEPIYNLREALSHPPLAERDVLVRVKSGRGEELEQMAGAVRFGGRRYQAEEVGAELGFHNREILISLGYSEDEIESLRKRP